MSQGRFEPLLLFDFDEEMSTTDDHSNRSDTPSIDSTEPSVPPPGYSDESTRSDAEIAAALYQQQLSPSTPPLYTSLHDPSSLSPWRTQVFNHDYETDVHELRSILHSMQDELATERAQVEILKEHHANEISQLLDHATSERQVELAEIAAERKQLAKEFQELKTLMEEISGGLETLEGFKRRKESELEMSEATEALVKPCANFVHVAVAGAAGAGRSSFINGIRGMASQRDAGLLSEFAPVGASMRGKEVKLRSYRDPRDHIMWYDVPSPIGVSAHPWDYFNSEGLFIFDAIILVINDAGSLSDTDIAVLQQARSRKNPIPVFMVKMKADLGIQSALDDLGLTNELEGRRVYCEGVKERVAEALSHYRGLDPEKKTYLASKGQLAAFAASALGAQLSQTNSGISVTADEVDLWKDMMRTLQRLWKLKCQQEGRPVPTSPPQMPARVPTSPITRDMVILTPDTDSQLPYDGSDDTDWSEV